jgi:hypothetical protein
MGERYVHARLLAEVFSGSPAQVSVQAELRSPNFDTFSTASLFAFAANPILPRDKAKKKHLGYCQWCRECL